MKMEKYLNIYLKDIEKFLSLEGKPDHVKMVIIALQFYLEGRGQAREALLNLSLMSGIRRGEILSFLSLEFLNSWLGAGSVQIRCGLPTGPCTTCLSGTGLQAGAVLISWEGLYLSGLRGNL